MISQRALLAAVRPLFLLSNPSLNEVSVLKRPPVRVEISRETCLPEFVRRFAEIIPEALFHCTVRLQVLGKERG